MKSIHKSQTFIQMSKFVQSCLNFSKILQTFKLQPFFFNCLNLPVAIAASVGLSTDHCSGPWTENSCESFFFVTEEILVSQHNSRQGSLAKPLYCCRRYHLTRTSLLWFCWSPWIFIQLNNFFKFPTLGIKPLTLGLQVQHSPPTPQGLPSCES